MQALAAYTYLSRLLQEQQPDYVQGCSTLNL
jgi:hypothetical protein